MKRLGVFKELPSRAPDTLGPASQWQRRGECARPGYDPETWFPVGEGPAAKQQADEAKAACHGCPVMTTCLNWAMDTRQDAGIWGGLDEKERHNLRRRRARAEAQQAPSISELQAKAQDMCEERSIDVGGGHREWLGKGPRRIGSVVFSAKQLAWTAEHGTRPTVPLLPACSHKGCITPRHQRLAVPAPQARAAAECGTPKKPASDSARTWVSSGHGPVGHRPRKVTPAQTDEILALSVAGASLQELALKYGVTVNTIRGYAVEATSERSPA